jgi:hypothetical protein
LTQLEKYEGNVTMADQWVRLGMALTIIALVSISLYQFSARAGMAETAVINFSEQRQSSAARRLLPCGSQGRGICLTFQKSSLTGGVCAMDRTVARLNIAHFERLLATETDEQRRALLKKLLAEERAKLSATGPTVFGRARD